MDAADLVFAGAARQAELVAAKEVSPRELVDACLERIEHLDPQLNAFRVVFAERARLEAKQAEARRGAKAGRPLLGVPIAIKDDQDVAGEVTAYGSNAHGGPKTADSEIVRRLREAGAIVIGKTHVSEMTAMPWTETQTFGATRNPWDPNRTVGGSSGGSACAVASGMVGIATASDGLGSIRIPAAACGVYGLKPQRGRVSLLPKEEEWQGLAVYGAVTRSVRDTAAFLDAVADVPADAPFAEAAAAPPSKLRIALSYKIPPPLTATISADVRRVTEETADRLRALGHEVVERDPEYPLNGSADAVVRYLRGIADDVATLPHPERLSRLLRRMARAGRLIPDAVVARARANEEAMARRIGGLFTDCDVLLTPALAVPPIPIGRWAGHGLLVSSDRAGRFVPFCGPWNVTGQPACTIPSGTTADGFPLSVQLVGRPHDEATLLSLSSQLESEHPWADRRPPSS